MTQKNLCGKGLIYEKKGIYDAEMGEKEAVINFLGFEP